MRDLTAMCTGGGIVLIGAILYNGNIGSPQQAATPYASIGQPSRTSAMRNVSTAGPTYYTQQATQFGTSEYTYTNPAYTGSTGYDTRADSYTYGTIPGYAQPSFAQPQWAGQPSADMGGFGGGMYYPQQGGFR